MALKIFTGAKPFLKAYRKPFDIQEIEMLTMEAFAFISSEESGIIIFLIEELDAAI
jgi:hypothetical protein